MRLLSVIVPCRNERAHVDALLDAVAAQLLPEGWTLELLVADGRSDDGTRERLDERARAEPRLVVIDNPRRIVSTGLNACLARARGEVIARWDMHSRYADDYLARCLATLDRTRADNVGGPWVAVGAGPMQCAIAAAFQSRWVAGGARSRDVGYEGEVETVYLGCWPRASFERFGAFDETLVRNQDDEHNLRIRLAGGRVWQSARIRSGFTFTTIVRAPPPNGGGADTPGSVAKSGRTMFSAASCIWPTVRVGFSVAKTRLPTGTLPASKRVTKAPGVPGGIKLRLRFT